MSDHVEGKNDAENGVALESSGGIDIHSKRKFKGRRGADIEPRKKFKGDRYSGDIQDGYRFVDSEPRIRHFPINQNEHYMEEEIAAMDEDGIQEPLKIEEIERIMNEFHDACHDLGTVCCVCDQFCSTSNTSSLSLKKMSPNFLKPLLAPVDEDDAVLPLHGDLVRQYDVSEFFDQEERQVLHNVLLSPRGIFRPNTENLCESRLIFCQDCYRALKRKRLPKFAIANGNWFG